MKYVNDDILKGAWIINLGKKLNNFQNTIFFDKLLDASKIGLLLQVITANDIENTLTFEELKIKAKSIGINSIRELKAILEELKNLNLIDYNQNLEEIVVLGLTNNGILKNTTLYFNEYVKNIENNYSSEVIIEVSEKVTNMPNKIEEVSEEFSDIFKLSKTDIEKYLKSAIQYELLNLDQKGNYLYNSNIFRVDEIKKIEKILNNLSPQEKKQFIELSNELKEKKCLDFDICKKQYDEKLLSKLIKASIIDINIVDSPYGKAIYVTLPSSFRKFTNNALIDDVMDFAKAFLSSIYYGMHKSERSRGKLDTYYFVLNKLINGEEIGCADAICEDYRYLEIKGVIKVSRCKSYGCKMKLLKKEVGEIVFKLLEEGIVFDNIKNMEKGEFNTKILDYVAPDEAKKQVMKNEIVITDILEIVRTN